MKDATFLQLKFHVSLTSTPKALKMEFQRSLITTFSFHLHKLHLILHVHKKNTFDLLLLVTKILHSK